MKKILTLIFLSVFCLNAINAEVTWELSEDGTLTISGTGDMEDYAPWDSQRDKIKEIIIENGVTSIGYNVFHHCYNLTSITIPNSVTSIGNSAFYDCYRLTSITIPNSVVSIGSYAFYDCGGLISVNIPNSVTNIGESAFYRCYNLKSITIPNNVTSIDDNTFEYCWNLTSVTIPNSVTSIGESAFARCTRLTSVTIPNSVTSIGDNAFVVCTDLTSITIPNSVTNIGISTFEGCTGLISMKVESGNLYYDSRNNCNAIIRKSDNALVSGCKTTIIPNNVTSIGRKAFSGCTGLISITVPNSVTSIDYLAFSGCNGLTSITIPNSVTNIGEYAFAWCTGLTSFTIPNSVTSIGRNAFSGCTGLTSITLSNSLITISDGAFGNCTGLTSITIPNSVTSIGTNAFSGCTGLTSITIPNSVTSIGSYVFARCAAITSMKVESGNTYYDSRNDCNAIIRKNDNTLVYGCKNTIIPNDVTGIGYYAFSRCTSLTSITVPNSVKRIDSGAFSGCTGLNKITIDVNKYLEIWGNIFYESGLEPKDLIMKGETLPYVLFEDGFADGLYNTITLHVPSSLYDEYCSTSPWSKFKNIVKLTDEPINLVDGDTFANEEECNGQKISYTRTFNHTKWQALYIPFSMSYEDWKNDFDIAYINGIRQYDLNDDGDIDETIMDVIKIKQGSLIPNTPYLIRAKTIGEKTITVTDATLYKAEENSIDCRTTIAEYTFTGNYSTIPASTLIENNYYAMGGGSLVITDGTNGLNPYRWYMKIDSRSPMYNVSNGAKAITINVIGEEETTGICQLRMTNDELPVYDLNGRKVNENNLKPGVYVKNGKKIIIK